MSADHVRPPLRPMHIVIEEQLGRRVAPSTGSRWIIRGVRIRGQVVRLRATRVGGAWYLDSRAFPEFLAAQTAAGLGDVPDDRPTLRTAEIEQRLRKERLLE